MLLLLSCLLALPVSSAEPTASETTPATAAPTAPTIQEGFVLRPAFHTTGGVLQAGTAFGLDVDGRYLVVSAHDLFGPNGGLAAQITADDLPGFVSEVELRDAYTGRPIGTAGAALHVADAAPMKDSAGTDLALFPIDKPDPMKALSISMAAVIRPARLAPADPAPGDPIWLVAPLVNATKDTPKAIPARVALVQDGWLFYEFDSTDLDMTATAGAPIINAKGQVVGMHLGAGTMKGRLVGSANPRASLETRIKAALAPTE